MRTPIRALCAAVVAGLVILALSPRAHAEGVTPDRLYLPLTARHANIDPANFGLVKWNETNPGLILSWEDRFLGLDYSLGVVRNSFDKTSAYAGVGKFWSVAPEALPGLSVGLVAALADYGTDARFIETRIGSSGWVVTGGPQVNFRNLFVQIQPVPQANGKLGSIWIAGFTVPLGQ